MLDQHELAHARLALPQRKAPPFCKPDQDLAGPVHKPRIGREHHVVGLHRGIDETRLSSDVLCHADVVGLVPGQLDLRVGTNLDPADRQIARPLQYPAHEVQCGDVFRFFGPG